MAYTQGKQDGSQGFGFTDGKFDGFIVESYSESTPANRVDLDDGNGKPIGSTVVPQRKEVSLTVQMGDASGSVAPPQIGEVVQGYDGNNIAITGVDVNETQADYVRMTITGFVVTGTSLTPLTDIT